MTFEEKVNIILRHKCNTRKTMAEVIAHVKSRNEELEARIVNLKDDIGDSRHKVGFLDSEIKRLNQEIRTLEAVVVHQSKKMMGI